MYINYIIVNFPICQFCQVLLSNNFDICNCMSGLQNICSSTELTLTSLYLRFIRLGMKDEMSATLYTVPDLILITRFLLILGGISSRLLKRLPLYIIKRYVSMCMFLHLDDIRHELGSSQDENVTVVRHELLHQLRTCHPCIENLVIHYLLMSFQYSPFRLQIFHLDKYE